MNMERERPGPSPAPAGSRVGCGRFDLARAVPLILSCAAAHTAGAARRFEP